MRLLTSAVAVTALTSALVVAPTVTSGARPRPVTPVVHERLVPAVAASALSVRRTGANGDPIVAETAVHDTDFDVAGVTFGRTPPTGTQVEVRTHDGSGWSAWTTLLVGDDGPDAGSADARHARIGTESLAAAGSDGIAIRVTTPDGSAPAGVRLTLVDGGRSAADSAIDAPAGSAVADVTRPTIISRAGWGADESLRTCEPEQLSGFKAVVVHHTVNSNTYSADDVPALLRGIYAYHVESLGWCDIGYQLLVDRFGRVFEGRKGSPTQFVMGAQTGGFNAETTGVSVLGDFTSVPFTTAAQGAVSRVVAWEADRSVFDPSTTVTLTSAGSSRYAAGVRVTKPRTMGHRDLSLTECPGDTAYGQLSAIRSSAAATWRDGQWDPMAARTVHETYARPSATSFALAGRGYGHGIGMSQWGAYGAATRGLTWQQTLGFYYPGTSRASQGTPLVRVLLQAVGTSATELVPQSGTWISDGSRRTSLSTAYRWRIVPEGGTVSLQAYYDSRWNWVTSWRGSTAPLVVSRPDYGMLRVALPSGSQREYRGVIRVAPVSGKALPVNVVAADLYVRGVVPLEMSPSWPAAALASQAVAARTFAAYGRSTAGSRVYDTCDTACQAYRGVADYSASGSLLRRYEDSRATAAVSATAGIVLTYGGKPALTQYSASNGGRSVSGGTAYLVARSDPYDGVVTSSSNPHTWRGSLSVAAIEKHYPAIGTLRRLTVGSRTGGGGGGTFGGRVASVTLTGSSGSVTVTGSAFRSALGLRSTWWAVVNAPPRSTAYSPRDVTGDALPDVIVPSGSTITTLSYTGSMSFTTKKILSGGFSGLRAAAAVGPFGPDNLGDVVAIDSSGTAWYYPGLGSLGLNAGRTAIATGWGSVNLVVPTGDWDGDGYTDIATRMTDGRLVLRRGNGAGRIVSSVTIGSSGWNSLRQVTSGEYDGDGHRDLVAVRTSDGALVLYPGNGSGGFRTPRVIGGSGWNAMSAVRGVGDLTGDGRDDLLARRASDGALFVYRVIDAARLVPALRAGTSTSTAPWGQ